MRIVIFGAGAIGSYFGASLILAGNDVEFLRTTWRSRNPRDKGDIPLPEGDGAKS